MKSYRYSLSITSQFYFCGIPFRLDTTPKCSLNCLYCFAMSRGGRRTSSNLIASPEIIRRKFEQAAGGRVNDIKGRFIKNRAPLHFGGMSDPFSNNLSSKVSMELLDILKEFEYPTVISTKQTNELIKPQLFCKLKEMKNLVIQVSIPSVDTEISKIIEPNLPSPKARIDTISQLAKEGFFVVVRLQPLLPIYVRSTADDTIPRFGEAGVKHVAVEFLKLPVERTLSTIHDMFNALSWNGKEYYEKNCAIRTGREWVLPAAFKWELLQPVIESIHKSGMTYGAADYGLNHLGDTDCCCGFNQSPGFENWFQDNIAYRIRKQGKGTLTFQESISDESHSIRMFLNSHCRKAGLSTVSDYIKSKWNNPSTENSPDSYLGVLNTGDFDENKNCVYFYTSEYEG